MAKVDISKKDKARVLQALYNHARPVGMGYLHYVPGDMDIEVARELIRHCQEDGYFYFDYLQGRLMKISLDGDFIETALYDRDNGEGTAERAIAEVPDEC